MNTQTQRLLEKVNDKIKEKPLFYFSKEAERGIGLEPYLENYHFVASNNDFIAKQVNAEIVHANSSQALFTQDLLTSYNHTGFYAQSFYHSLPLQFKIKHNGGKLLNPPANVSKQFENKLFNQNLFRNPSVNFPKNIVANLDSECAKDFEYPFVIQFEKSHTGTGTFIIHDKDEFINVVKQFKATSCKISEFIEGIPITINACVTNSNIYVAGIQYQITGIEPFTNRKSTTVGNDFEYGALFLEKHKEEIKKLMNSIGETMRKKGFLGLFGTDVIIRDSEIFLIEVNARQTANIPLQTQLELYADVTPLHLIHLCYFLDIDVEKIEHEFIPLYGSQIFLRSNNNKFVVNSTVQSGMYRLQSDNSAFDWEDGNPKLKKSVLFIDENKDQPLIFQKEAYQIKDLKEGGFLLFAQPKDSVRNETEELARFQFNTGIVQDGKVTPWISDAMKMLRFMLQ